MLISLKILCSLIIIIILNITCRPSMFINYTLNANNCMEKYYSNYGNIITTNEKLDQHKIHNNKGALLVTFTKFESPVQQIGIPAI